MFRQHSPLLCCLNEFDFPAIHFLSWQFFKSIFQITVRCKFNNPGKQWHMGIYHHSFKPWLVFLKVSWWVIQMEIIFSPFIKFGPMCICKSHFSSLSHEVLQVLHTHTLISSWHENRLTKSRSDTSKEKFLRRLNRLLQMMISPRNSETVWSTQLL